jgi:hypothetical protein
MNMKGREFILSMIVTAAVMTTALGQDVRPAVGAASTNARTIASIPDFSGTWAHPFLNGLEPPLSGPGPVRNRARGRGPQAGVSSINQLVGDYTNPILQPWAAEVVKKLGESSLAGQAYPTPRNQCWPEQVPFVFINYGMHLIQQANKITILYPFDHQFRQVRLNQPHPSHVTPSWYGDSVGHYEGDTLVIDTVRIKVGPFSMIDWFGTPFSEDLHLVERYRLLDYESTIKAIERGAKEHFQQDNPYNGVAVDPNYKGKGLQMELIVVDEGAFTVPWSAAITFRRSSEEWRERVCAENTHEYYAGKDTAVPRADKPDF